MGPRDALVQHGDRGSQYLSIRYTERLAESGIGQSVGSVGDSHDNALAEHRKTFITASGNGYSCTHGNSWGAPTRFLHRATTGAQSCIGEVGFCFPRATVGRGDFDEVVRKYYHRWDVSIDEDNATGELQQAGLRSVLRTPGPYSHTEAVVHRFANWVLARVLD